MDPFVIPISQSKIPKIPKKTPKIPKTPNKWNQFQKNNAHKGYSSVEMKELYKTTKNVKTTQPFHNRSSIPDLPLLSRPNKMGSLKTREVIRQSRTKAFLYIQPDRTIDWTDLNFVVGYLNQNGKFYNVALGKQNKEFKLIGRQKWEHLKNKSTTITVRDVINSKKSRKSRKSTKK